MPNNYKIVLLVVRYLLPLINNRKAHVKKGKKSSTHIFGSLHGVSLSGTSLAIGEDAHVVAVQHGLNKLRNFLKHFLLGRQRFKHPVKIEVVLHDRL